MLELDSVTVRRVLAVLALTLAALFIPAPAHAAVTTRMEIVTPSGTPVPCGSNVDGIGSVIMRGFVNNTGNPQNVRTRFGYGIDPGGNGEGWYALYRQNAPTGETLLREVSQRLSPSTTHNIKFGSTASGIETCSFTASNIPATSDKVTTPRPLPADPLEEMRLAIRRYSDNTLIGTCTSASPQAQPFVVPRATMGRLRYIVEVRQDGASGYHSLHTHEETGPPLAVSGPQWWEDRAESLFVNGGGAWTQVTDTTAAQTDGTFAQFHAAQGFAGQAGFIEVFCAVEAAP